jgi:hypothetical protein
MDTRKQQTFSMDARKQQNFPWKRARLQQRRAERFIRKTDVVQGSRSERQNQVSHSRRKNTRGPVRNGESLRQSLIVSCYN